MGDIIMWKLIKKVWSSLPSMCDYGAGRKMEIELALDTIETVLDEYCEGLDDPCWKGEHMPYRNMINNAMELIREELS
jgi:hypothetical protein